MKRWIHRLVLVALITVQVFAYPAIGLAETAPGPQQPTGADSQTYHYNDQTGLWENDHYTWNPATNQTTPKTTPSYSYNPQTGMWDTTEYRYDAAKGSYVPQVVSIVKPSVGVATTTTAPTSTVSSGRQKSATGPQSDNSVSSKTNNTGTFDLFYNKEISNSVTQTAKSGNATVSDNTLAGIAQSGDVSNLATILNLLQSSLMNSDPSNIRIFNATLEGNVAGDVQLDPSQLAPSSTLASDTTKNTEIKVNTSDNNAITNNIDLAATSGNATVTGNTEAGDARTGDATALANVINLISSTIRAGQAFLGNLNIIGSLDGDILLPAGMQDQLLDTNDPGSAAIVTDASNLDVQSTATNATGIRNNTDVAANSGNASVSGNTTAGNATTGAAATNVNSLNVAGEDVVGKNAIFVFINNLGHWTGAILNAPQGATAAALGGNVSRTATRNAAITANSATNNSITNNVRAHTTSGDAEVNGNTQAGNATSGNAKSGVNLLNVSNANYSLSDWFGVLFINVLGSWSGSFGIDTPAGTRAAAAATSVASYQSRATPGGVVLAEQTHYDQSSTSGTIPAPPQTAVNTAYSSHTTRNNPVTINTATTQEKPLKVVQKDNKTLSTGFIASIVSVAFGLLLVIFDRVRALRRN